MTVADRLRVIRAGVVEYQRLAKTTRAQAAGRPDIAAEADRFDGIAARLADRMRAIEDGL